MKKKKMSFGAFLAAFIRVIITLILSVILVVSVAVNIIFYSDNSAVKIDLFKMHYTLFVNNSGNLDKISPDSLVIVNHEMKPQTNTYVLCTVGNGYKTVLSLASTVQNDNGSVSYEVKGDKENSTINYKIPESKIIGTVVNKSDAAGNLVTFARKIPGIVTLMAIPAFLLILMSIAGIKRNKIKYEDAILESEIVAEELRKINKINQKKETQKKSQPVQEPQTDEEYDEDQNYADEIQGRKAADDYEDEMNRKAIEMKKSLHNQTVEEASPKKLRSKYRSDDDMSANDLADQIVAEKKRITERPTRTERQEYTERPARAERQEYTERPARAERQEYTERPARTERQEYTERPARTERQEYTEKPARAERQEYTERPARTERQEYTERPARTERQEYAERPARAERLAYTKKPVQAERPAYTEKPARAERPAYTEKPVRAERQEYTERPAHVEQSVRTEKPAYTERPVRPEESIYTESSSYSEPVKERSAKPAKKTAAPKKSSLKADSIDDLIKLLDNEKKKL